MRRFALAASLLTLAMPALAKPLPDYDIALLAPDATQMAVDMDYAVIYGADLTLDDAFDVCEAEGFELADIDLDADADALADELAAFGIDQAWVADVGLAWAGRGGEWVLDITRTEVPVSRAVHETYGAALCARPLKVTPERMSRPLPVRMLRGI